MHKYNFNRKAVAYVTIREVREMGSKNINVFSQQYRMVARFICMFIVTVLICKEMSDYYVFNRKTV